MIAFSWVLSRALHWVPIPMPMSFGWAWVRYYCSWVGMGSILLFMGEHGLKHIKRALIHFFEGKCTKSPSPNKMSPSFNVSLGSQESSASFLSLSCAFAYHNLPRGFQNLNIATVSLAFPVNRDTTAKFNILLWWMLKGTFTFPIMSCKARLVLCIPASNSK